MNESPCGEVCLMTIGEVAKVLRLHPTAVRRLNARGQGPLGFKIGRSRRWLASEVENYLKDLARKAIGKK